MIWSKAVFRSSRSIISLRRAHRNQEAGDDRGGQNGQMKWGWPEMKILVLGHSDSSGSWLANPSDAWPFLLEREIGPSDETLWQHSTES